MLIKTNILNEHSFPVDEGKLCFVVETVIGRAIRVAQGAAGLDEILQRKFDLEYLAIELDEGVKEILLGEELGVSISLINDEEMKVLNRDYHDVDLPTDVLSFGYYDSSSEAAEEVQGARFKVQGFDQDVILGDVVLDFEYAKRQAASKGVSVQEELEFLVEHSLYHLLGLHHE